jgi:hypothetical protein
MYDYFIPLLLLEPLNNYDCQCSFLPRYLLRQSANPALCDRAGRSALHQACATGLVGLLEDLLAAAAAGGTGVPSDDTEDQATTTCITEASITAPDGAGLAPIHAACRWGKLNCARILCETQPISLELPVAPVSLADDPAAATAIASASAAAGVGEGDTPLCVAMRVPDEEEAVAVALFLCEEGGDGQVIFLLLAAIIVRIIRLETTTVFLTIVVLN